MLVRLQHIETEGWGSGSMEAATQKAKSEAFERAAFLLTNGGTLQSSSSNGWAAHVSLEQALENAVAELIERDSAVSAWLGVGNYLRVPQELWPQAIFAWADSNRTTLEFGIPEVLLSIGPSGAAGSVVLRSQDGGAVAGHASGTVLGVTLEAAFQEALRAAHGALQFDSFAEVKRLHSNSISGYKFGPGANAYAYAYGMPLPKMEVSAASTALIENEWATHVHKLHKTIRTCNLAAYTVGDRFVVQAKTPEMREMFWGNTPKVLNQRNKNPHFVG